MTPAQLVAAYKKWGVKVVEVTRGGRSWRDHYRPGAYGDMHGQIAHHTGPFGSVSGMIAMLWNGRPDLNGPLCTDGIGQDGTVYMIGGGRANHAGKGASNVYAALVDGRMPPAPWSDSVDGNKALYGDEVLNAGDGQHYYPNEQFEALVRVHAARAQFHGWDARSSIRHGGWTRRKVDTNGKTQHGDQITQAFLQTEVGRALRLGPKAYSYPATAPNSPTPTPVAPAPVEEENDMQLTDKIPGTDITVGVLFDRQEASQQAVNRLRADFATVKAQLVANTEQLGRIEAALAALAGH